MDGLPEELLADVLSRLPPRSVATCRSVCNGWCAAIDTRGMLLGAVQLVPHRVRGIYINFVSNFWPYFFSREPTSPAIDAALDFMQAQTQSAGYGSVVDHRNGLLLYKRMGAMYVCNPATRRRAQLPAGPADDRWYCSASAYLMFDPTVSLHYEVLVFADPPRKYFATERDIERFFPKSPSSSETDDWKRVPLTKYALGAMPWPPASYPVQVFSSRTGLWVEKHFVREDDTTVTMSDVWSYPWGPSNYGAGDSFGQYHAVYWREGFYRHCPGGFITRFSLLNDKYLVIKTPKLDNIFSHPTLAGSNERKREITPRVYIGKSQQGIYCTAIYNNELRVWVLQEEASDSRGVPRWELKHQASLESSFSRHYARRRVKEKIDQSWNLDRGDHKRHTNDTRDHEWDSDDDSGVDVGGGEDGEEEEVGSITDYWDKCANERLDFLGFHPHKEIIFLGKRFEGFAYSLSSSKLQYLGSFGLPGYRYDRKAPIYESFIYTPCMYDMLPLPEEEDDNDDEDIDDDDDDDDEYGDTDDDEHDDEEEEKEDDGEVYWM